MIIIPFTVSCWNFNPKMWRKNIYHNTQPIRNGFYRSTPVVNGTAWVDFCTTLYYNLFERVFSCTRFWAYCDATQRCCRKNKKNSSINRLSSLAAVSQLHTDDVNMLCTKYYYYRVSIICIYTYIVRGVTANRLRIRVRSIYGDLGSSRAGMPRAVTAYYIVIVLDRRAYYRQ